MDEGGDGGDGGLEAGADVQGEVQGQESAACAQGRTLAAKLDHLFRLVHPSGRGEYSLEEVAAAIRQSGGPTISATYLWLLRKGKRDNPTRKHLEALADFFGVAPAYFFDHDAAARIDAQIDLAVALRDAPIRQIALRSYGLSPDSLRAIAQMIDHVRHLEGLPPQADEAQLPGTRAGNETGRDHFVPQPGLG